jgi:multidrug efflux pump subunit AcrB
MVHSIDSLCARIIVLENIVRRIREEKEPPLLAAYNGTRQVGFAVLATTAVLVAVFVPITFLDGDIGRLFTEFAVTLATAVIFSGIVSLTLSPMLSSKLLKAQEDTSQKDNKIEIFFVKVRTKYGYTVEHIIKKPIPVIIAFLVVTAGIFLMVNAIPSEYTPKEDRGAFFINVTGPEGASFSYMKEYMDEIFPSPDPKETIDVSGAGDTFTASFTLKYLETNDIKESIIYANKMASIVVSKRGVSTPWGKQVSLDDHDLLPNIY